MEGVHFSIHHIYCTPYREKEMMKRNYI